jgi:hypothetical protein
MVRGSLRPGWEHESMSDIPNATQVVRPKVPYALITGLLVVLVGLLAGREVWWLAETWGDDASAFFGGSFGLIGAEGGTGATLGVLTLVTALLLAFTSTPASRASIWWKFEAIIIGLVTIVLIVDWAWAAWHSLDYIINTATNNCDNSNRAYDDFASDYGSSCDSGESLTLSSTTYAVLNGLIGLPAAVMGIIGSWAAFKQLVLDNAKFVPANEAPTEESE